MTQKQIKLYKGRRFGQNGHPIVTVNGKLLSFYRHVLDVSEDFEWGYGGSGPTQLSMALIMDATGDAELAYNLRHQFKQEVVKYFSDNWAMTDDDILARLKRIQEP